MRQRWMKQVYHTKNVEEADRQPMNDLLMLATWSKHQKPRERDEGADVSTLTLPDLLPTDKHDAVRTCTLTNKGCLLA